MSNFHTPEMQEAYTQAVADIDAEEDAPEYIQEVRRKALLRWLKDD